MQRTTLGVLCGVVVLGASCTAHRVARRPSTAPGVEQTAGLYVTVDRREELFAVLFRLAGAAPYRDAPATRYAKDVDAHFAAFSAHRAVAATRALVASKHLGDRAPVALLARLDQELQPLAPLAPLPPELDPRWQGVELDGYLAQVRAFARDSGFDAFFAAHAPYFHAVEQRLRPALASARVVAWFDELFGKRPDATLTVMPGLLSGSSAFTARAELDDVALEVALVLPLEGPDAEELPRPSEATVELVVRGLAHSYLDPAVERRRRALESPLSTLLRLDQAALAKPGLTEPLAVGSDSLVSALAGLHLRDTQGPRRLDAFSVDEAARGLSWIGGLAAALDEAMNDYPAPRAPEALMPRVVRFFEELAERTAKDGLPRAPFHGPLSAVNREAAALVPPKRGSLTATLIPYVTSVRKTALKDALLVEDTVPWGDLHGRDVVLYGSPWSNQLTDDLLRRAGWQVTPAGVRLGLTHVDGADLVLVACRASPADPSHGALVLTAAKDETLVGADAVPRGEHDWVVARRLPDGTFETVAQGSFGP